MGTGVKGAPGRGESGQAAVEAAVVLPLFVFLILGTIQLSMMHQARLMAKYAAYRAVRAGALHNAHKDIMEKAGLAVLLPMVSQQSGKNEILKPLTKAEDFQKKWDAGGLKDNRMLDVEMPYVEVTICGPKKADLPGGARELDFDDPRFASSDAGGSDTDTWKQSNLTKLRIQVTLNYRLPIPFANWVIHSIAMQRELPMLMRMGKQKPGPQAFGQKYEDAAKKGVYVLPIRAAYTMRMQSNLHASQLPETNKCLTTNKY